MLLTMKYRQRAGYPQNSGIITAGELPRYLQVAQHGIPRVQLNFLSLPMNVILLTLKLCSSEEKGGIFMERSNTGDTFGDVWWDLPDCRSESGL